MTTKIKWRLGLLPTPDEVGMLTREGIITKDEAREILISHETEEDRDKKSLQEEIKFLRQLVQNISGNPSIIYRTIERIQQPYLTQPWYPAYQAYCSSATTANLSNSILTASGSGSSQAIYTASAGSSSSANTVSLTGSGTTAQSSSPSFTTIKTF